MNPSHANPSPARLLIIDDDAPQTNALRDLLRPHNYEMVGVTTAKDGLAALRESKFDLLLANLSIAESDDMSFLHSAAEIDPDLVVLILTHSATAALESAKSGVFDFILKPFELSALLPILSRALSFRRLRIENSELKRRLQEHSHQLQKANQELDSFTHCVSHDLRAPLRAIGGFSNILLKDFAPQLPKAGQRLLNIVITSAAQLTQMIDGLLIFSHLGRQPIVTQPIDFTALLKQTVDELCRDQKRPLEFQIANLPNCPGDPALLKEALANLLSNAIKFTARTEHPVIEIGSHSGDREHTYFVRDNGIGFDMQDAERLFDVFGRLHSEQEFDGPGLGLAIAKRIIERHNGRIWADSEPNQGATFFFTLPAAT
jgi:signal transduction histidine kinase